jgi:hypothetical protein
MSLPEMIQALGEKSPGGLGVLVRMQRTLKPIVCIAAFIVMDQRNIIGDNIWGLWEDSGQDMDTFINDLTGGIEQ